MAVQSTNFSRPEWFITIVAKIHFMYFALLIVIITTLVAVVVSLMTEPPSKEQVGGRISHVNIFQCQIE